MIAKPKENFNSTHIYHVKQGWTFVLVSIIPDNCIKQLVSMNVSLCLKFKNITFTEEKRKCHPWPAHIPDFNSIEV